MWWEEIYIGNIKGPGALRLCSAHVHATFRRKHFRVYILTIVYSTVYSGADILKHQSSASLASVRGIHRWIPSQMSSEAENVSIWWRHHEFWLSPAPALCSRYGNGVFDSIDYAAFSRLKMHYDIFFLNYHGYFQRFTGFRVKNTKRTLIDFCNFNTNIIFAYLHVHQWTDPLLVLVVVYCPFDTNRLPHSALTYINLWKFNRGADILFRKIPFF